MCGGVLTSAAGGCSQKWAEHSLKASRQALKQELMMPYYVGKHSSGVRGSQHVLLRRKIIGEDTERQSCWRWRV